MRHLIVACLVLAATLALTACATSTAITVAYTAATVIRLGKGIYCEAVTEEGKQAIRDAATGGVRLVECPAGTRYTSTP